MRTERPDGRICGGHVARLKRQLFFIIEDIIKTNALSNEYMYWNSEQTQLEMQMTSLEPKRFAAIQLWLKAIKLAPPQKQCLMKGAL